MPDTTPAPAAIFFDIDDTLLDDDTASSAGLRAIMDALAHPDFTAARHLWDVQTDISFNAYIDGRLSFEEQRRERVRALATQAGHPPIPDAQCDDLYQRYLQAHRAAWQPFDDVEPTLTHLATAGLGLGIITNGVERIQRDKLDALNLTRHFHTIVCADTAGAGKPDPAIFHTACSRLTIAPQRCWHIGDQVRADALGAVAAGVRPVLLDRHGRHGQHTDIQTIPSLRDLPPITTAPQPAHQRQ